MHNNTGLPGFQYGEQNPGLIYDNVMKRFFLRISSNGEADHRLYLPSIAAGAYQSISIEQREIQNTHQLSLYYNGVYLEGIINKNLMEHSNAKVKVKRNENIVLKNLFYSNLHSEF